jgi:23S rRNA pseudouridine1911/1915/1917 synthase
MLRIIFKDKNLVAVSKPQNMPSQPDPSGDADAMSSTSRLLSDMGESGELYLIHRLDRVVGGVMVFARNKKAAAELSRLVSDKDGFDKTYLAVIDGECGEGEYKDLIFKDSRISKAFIVDRKRQGVKDAHLAYKTVEPVQYSGRTLSLVSVSRFTGRFHQIRAQFAYHGYPLIGDGKYGSRDNTAKMPALFATCLQFRLFGKKYRIEQLPDKDMYPWVLFELFKDNGECTV